MKKLAFLCLLFLSACVNETPNSTTTTPETEAKTLAGQEIGAIGFEVFTDENAELDFEKLRLYPIVASEDHIAQHQALAEVRNLKEAMEIQGFRVMEKKPYGRQQNVGAVNTLTLQNKSQETVYLMAGDVVQGGNQDRVLAQDMMLPPRTLKDISVFCVEPNRWDYRGNVPEDQEDEFDKKNRKVFAFTGYYNVVSNNIRKTVKQEADQKMVWDSVNKMMASNDAVTRTGTYAALEESEEFTAERNRYLAFFEDKFENTEEVIGVVAVSGGKVLAADIFNHPNLFKKQYKVLLHSFITDAITNGDKVVMSEVTLKKYVEKMKNNYSKTLPGAKEAEMKFRHDGMIVHFSNL